MTSNEPIERNLMDEYKFWNDLCLQVGEWSQRNFGDQLPHRPLLGIIEEICELDDSLRALQRVDVIDAVGDIAVYMADYFHRQVAAGGNIGEWDLGKTWVDRALFDSDTPTSATLPLVVQMLSHHHLKGEQNIRGGTTQHHVHVRNACRLLLEHIEYASGLVNADIFEVVSETWTKVSKRDWKKNPNNAHEVAAMAANLEGVQQLEVIIQPERVREHFQGYLDECKRNNVDPGDVFE